MSAREQRTLTRTQTVSRVQRGEYFLVFRGANCGVGMLSLILFVGVRSLIQLPSLTSQHCWPSPES